MVNGHHEDDAGTESDEARPSKSQVKRDLLVHRKTAWQLVELPSSQIPELPDADIRNAVIQARAATKGNARKRLIQHIAKLIRSGKEEVISDFLARFDSASRTHLLRTRTLERWRTGLIEGNQVTFDEIVLAHPTFDRQQLRVLVRQAMAESEPADAYRKLFRFLRDLDESP
ncbi:MAG: DUF615 domain-containing protein [Proteobacteria bacterium]|jgi:ribosome-associated protein|nr:DUF615 domain-containing protein [Pseudomonadota bacterium]